MFQSHEDKTFDPLRDKLNSIRVKKHVNITLFTVVWNFTSVSSKRCLEKSKKKRENKVFSPLWFTPFFGKKNNIRGRCGLRNPGLDDDLHIILVPRALYDKHWNITQQDPSGHLMASDWSIIFKYLDQRQILRFYIQQEEKLYDMIWSVSY